jgi:putative endonuclease
LKDRFRISLIVDRPFIVPGEKMLNSFVYFLRSTTKNWIYVGMTRDLQRRLREHTDGEVQSTKAHRPLKLAGYVAVETEGTARRLERYFKTGSGKAVLKKRILAEEPPSSGA